LSLSALSARTESEALKVAFAVAESPLVKTALYAADPNWGRILAAVGRAGLEDLDVSRVDVFLDDVCIVESGGRSPTYTEAAGQAVMDGAEPSIRIVLGRGQAAERVWTCDFSHEYVTINAGVPDLSHGLGACGAGGCAGNRFGRKESLVAQRSAEQHQGGLLEFPGGKVDAEETPRQGLCRELREEVGISVDPDVPEFLMCVEHDYGDRRVRLDVFTITHYSGSPAGREGQVLGWRELEGLEARNFPLPTA